MLLLLLLCNIMLLCCWILFCCVGYIPSGWEQKVVVTIRRRPLLQVTSGWWHVASNIDECTLILQLILCCREATSSIVCIPLSDAVALAADCRSALSASRSINVMQLCRVFVPFGKIRRTERRLHRRRRRLLLFLRLHLRRTIPLMHLNKVVA